jgi:hypothetical protein
VASVLSYMIIVVVSSIFIYVIASFTVLILVLYQNGLLRIVLI